MKAVILAAGRGSRMGDLTEERPKCLVEFRGKSLIEWQLSALRQAGIEEICIVTGYKRELLSSLSLVEFHNPRWFETNMVFSLAQAHEWLASDECVISYSDIFYTKDSIERLKTAKSDLAITYDPNWFDLWSRRFENPLDDAESFLQKNGKLIEIGKKTKNLEEVQGQYMGLLKFTPEGWLNIKSYLEEISLEMDMLDMTSLLSTILDRKGFVQTIEISEEWHEFDSLNDVKSVREKES